MTRALLVACAMLAAACSSSPAGVVDGIRYETSLEGDYRLIEREGGREHVWVPDDLTRPMLSLRVSGLPTAVGEAPRCTPDDAYGWGTGLNVGPDDDIRHGSSVMVGLCSAARPDVGLMCSVYRASGYLEEADHAPFAAICRGITVR